MLMYCIQLASFGVQFVSEVSELKTTYDVIITSPVPNLSHVISIIEMSCPAKFPRRVYNIESIHTMHIRYLMLEFFKSLHSLKAGFMNSYFVKKPLYFYLRHSNKIVLPPSRTLKFGTISQFVLEVLYCGIAFQRSWSHLTAFLPLN